MIQSATVFPTVDYAAHPAFRGFTPAPPTNDRVLAEAIARADTALEELHASTDFVPVEEVERLYRTRIDPELDNIGRLTNEIVPGGLPISKALEITLTETRRELLKEALFHNDKKQFRSTARSPAAERIASELAEEGLSLHRIPQESIRAIYDDLAQYRERLLALATTNGGTNCALAIPRTGRYWKEVASFLHSSGILAGCSHYRREPLEPTYCALVLSHDGEQWWQGCYADVGIASTRTVYMHNDQDYDLMKALVYLDEVDAERGPFCFVRGSHKWRRSRTQAYFCKALDHGLNATFRPLEPGPTVYYRKAFRHPQFREQFLQIPQPLRGSSHFGDDVLDDSELSRWLLSQESAITSDVANCMAFIGADGIHRGGCVRKGRRWALQLGFRKMPPLHRRIERQAVAAYGFTRSKLRGAMRRVIGDQGLQTVRSLAQRVTGRP